MNTVPRATARLQLNKNFTFADAARRVPYFAELGVSHLYLSPILTARSGSMHGYDVVDHGSINPELGGEDEYRKLVATLRAHDMGVIVDIVPNHMAIGNRDNRLWLDVLEWGHASRYASFFDIDWEVPEPALKNKILAPFLGVPYGDALMNNEIKFVFDSVEGKFSAEYYEHKFPITPTTYPQLLRLAGGDAAVCGKRFREGSGSRGEIFAVACQELARSYNENANVKSAIDALQQRINGATENSRMLLHQLLERQHYRLSCWRNAADEINWRRFFDVIQLMGIRIQEPAAFEIVHAQIFRLYSEGLIDGLRIDHIDGLSDPRSYCRRLHRRLKRLMRDRPASAPNGPPYIIVEKILAPEERLPSEWNVSGTTGYSFMNDVSAMLHDPRGEQPLAELWTQVSGRSADFESENQRARRRILQEVLGAELNSCALALQRIARANFHTRDWSLLAIRRVLLELLIPFPIYRTYADARGRSAAEDQIMAQAIAIARPRCRGADVPLLDLLNLWLGGEPPLAAPPNQRKLRLRAIARFQQLTSPLAAKSTEDTAFYRHGKLLSRNEVGSNPAIFAINPIDFHAECVRRARHFPRALLATATHDHKRGEDLRSRLAVLSEIPEKWARAVQHWRSLNSPLKVHTGDGVWPTPGDEYMLYQMLVGAWPLDLSISQKNGLDEFADRLSNWLVKALREAKQISSWGEPNTDYEETSTAFLRALLDPEHSFEFLSQLRVFIDDIAAAGVVNSLTQTLLKLTTPGIPDLYQGCELWDFSLVDPDNRRPVDYDLRAHLLAECITPSSRLTDWHSGGIKQHLIATLLRARAQFPELFAQGDYKALTVSGELAPHVFAFARNHGNLTMVVAVVRLPASLGVRKQPAVSPEQWRNTLIHLPKPLLRSSSPWLNPLLDHNVKSVDTVVSCRDLFAPYPFALLLRDAKATA